MNLFQEKFQALYNPFRLQESLYLFSEGRMQKRLTYDIADWRRIDLNRITIDKWIIEWNGAANNGLAIGDHKDRAKC